jgi:hypothetical protein
MIHVKSPKEIELIAGRRHHRRRRTAAREMVRPRQQANNKAVHSSSKAQAQGLLLRLRRLPRRPALRQRGDHHSIPGTGVRERHRVLGLALYRRFTLMRGTYPAAVCRRGLRLSPSPAGVFRGDQICKAGLPRSESPTHPDSEGNGFSLVKEYVARVGAKLQRT